MPRATSYETSAGGLAVRLVGGIAQVVLIGRVSRDGRLRWSLPKGHVEPGETLEQTAVREVAEETGITGRIVAPLGHFDYSFRAGRRRIRKRVHHFLLRAESGELSDADIEVAEVAWVPMTDVAGRLVFDGERRMAATAATLIEGMT